MQIPPSLRSSSIYHNSNKEQDKSIYPTQPYSYVMWQVKEKRVNRGASNIL